MRLNLKVCLLLILLFTLTRVLVFSSNESVNGGVEECYIGTIANEIALGSTLEWHEMPYAHYQLGGVIDSYLTSIFYKEATLKNWGMKLVALFFSLVSFMGFLLLTRRFYSPFVNYTAPLFFIFAPEMFIRRNLIVGIVDFLPLMMYTLLATYFFFRIIKEDKGLKWVMVLGVFCGLGYLNNYLMGLPIALFILFFLFSKLRLIQHIKKYATLIIGFMLGSLPIWVYNIIYNQSSGAHLISSMQPSNLLNRFISKGIDVFFREFRLSFLSLNRVIDNMYYGIFLLGLFGGIIILLFMFSKIKLKDLLIKKIELVFPISLITLFFLVYSASRFGDFQRLIYFFPGVSNQYYYLFLYPFFFILIAYVANLLIKSKILIGKIMAITLILMVVILGGISINRLVKNDIGGGKFTPDCYKGSLDYYKDLSLNREDIYFSSLGQIFYSKWNSYNQPSSQPFSLCLKLHNKQRQIECENIVKYYFISHNQTLPDIAKKAEKSHIIEDINLSYKEEFFALSDYEKFIDNHGKTPISWEELEAQIIQTKAYLNKSPEGLISQDIRTTIIEGLDIDFLIDGLNERELKVTTVMINESKEITEKMLVFTDPYVGKFHVSLLIPKKKQFPLPSIIALHGHIASYSNLTFSFAHRYFLAKNGFVVIAPFFRAMDGAAPEINISTELAESGLSLMGLRVYETLLVEKYIRSLEIVDNQRIGLMGHSGGSTTVALSAWVSQDFKTLAKDMGVFLLAWGEEFQSEDFHCQDIPRLAYFEPQIANLSSVIHAKKEFNYGYENQQYELLEFFTTSLKDFLIN